MNRVYSVALPLLMALLCGAADAAQCDRACLTGMLTVYIDAVVAHDPARVPAAASLRFTEDSMDLRLGEGLWKTVTAKGGFRQDYLDEKNQIALTHVQLFEGKTQVVYSALLHVANARITGIETLVQRIEPDSIHQPDSLGKPLVGMNTPVPAGKRMSRKAMIATALTYIEGLRVGNFTTAKTPFAQEAYRMENGVFIAGVGCPSKACPGLYTQEIIRHPQVMANVAAVDEVNGIVILWMNFGDTHSYEPGNALIAFEGFKIWGGEIHAINAFWRTLPKDTQRGWPGSD